MVSQVPYRPPTIDNIRIVVECFYHFLIQSYICALDEDDWLKQGTLIEEVRRTRSLVLNEFAHTAQADFLCDEGLDQQGDAMADAAFYSLVRW